MPESQGLKADGVGKYCGFHLLTDNGVLRQCVEEFTAISELIRKEHCQELPGGPVL